MEEPIKPGNTVNVRLRNTKDIIQGVILCIEDYGVQLHVANNKEDFVVLIPWDAITNIFLVLRTQ